MESIEKFARKDTKTGKGMNEGFCFGDGEAYFEEETDALEYAKKLGYKSLKEAYKDDAYYHTNWEVDETDEDESYFDADGNEFKKCYKCKEETAVKEDFYFCTHCLTHL